MFLLGGGRLFTRSALQRHEEEEGPLLHSAVVAFPEKSKAREGCLCCGTIVEVPKVKITACPVGTPLLSIKSYLSYLSPHDNS